MPQLDVSKFTAKPPVVTARRGGWGSGLRCGPSLKVGDSQKGGPQDLLSGITWATGFDMANSAARSVSRTIVYVSLSLSR